MKWPDWRPPADDAQAPARSSRLYEGRPDNPLGARAIYLGVSIYRIHGTNEPSSIGKPRRRAASACSMPMSANSIQHVRMGATVTVC